MTVQLQLAGMPRAVTGQAAPVALGARDAALLTWLALEGPTPRARIAQLLWPQSSLAQARTSLRQRLFQLRRQLGVEVVTGHQDLALVATVQHDLADADTVLAMLGESIGDEFDQWLASQRDRRRTRVRQALVELADLAESARDYADALTHAEELLALEPLSEDAHRRVIRLHYLAGDRASALLAFDHCEKTLKDEVGTQPSAQTLALLATLEASAEPPGPVARTVPASVLRPPRMIGRDAESRALVDAWAQGHAVVVAGDGGLGKTRLISDFAARQPGVLQVSARPGDDRVSYATLSRLLRQLPRERLDGLDPSLRQELAHLLPELGPASAWHGEADRIRLFNAIALVLSPQSLGIQGCIVDDLHFADAASVEALQLAWGGGRCKWLVAAREAEVGDAGRQWLQALDALPSTTRVALKPLTREQIEALVDSLGIDGLSGAESSATLMGHAGGNPLYLLETIKAWWVQGGATDGTRLGERLPQVANVSALIVRRIGQLSMVAVQLARCAAVAAPDFSIELASQVLGVRTLALADPLAELEAAQVLRDGAFAHDLIYEAALNSVPAPVARQLHGEIAEFLAARQGEPARVAAHWLAAGDLAKGLEALMQAADAAGRALRWREQIALLEKSVDLAERIGRHDLAFRSMDTLIDVQKTVDHALIQESTIGRLETLARSDRDRVIARIQRCWFENNRGRYDECIRLGDEAIELARGLAEPAMLLVAACLVAGSAVAKSEVARAVRVLQTLLPEALRCEDLALRANYMNDLACCLDNCDRMGEAQPYFRLATDLNLQRGRPDDAAHSQVNLSRSLSKSGRMLQALDELEQAQRLLASLDTAVRGTAWHLDIIAFDLLRQLGRYAAALQVGEVALRAAEQHPPALPLVHCDHANLWLHLGQPARAHQALAQARRGDHPVQRLALIARLQAMTERAMGGDGAEPLQRARDHALQSRREGLINSVRLEASVLLEPEQSLSVCTEVFARADELGYSGVALAAAVQAARCAALAGHMAQATHWATVILRTPDRIVVHEGSFAERWLVAGDAFAAAGQDHDAVSAWRTGVQWVRQTANDQVPEAFRDSFLHRNPVHRELLVRASRFAL